MSTPNDDAIQISIEGEPCITLAQLIAQNAKDGDLSEEEIAFIRRLRPVETARIGVGAGSFSITRWL